MPGLVDQAAAAGLGWRAFAGELRDGMTQYEREVAAPPRHATPDLADRERRPLMETAEIRRRFLAHFENAGHTVVPSAPLLFDDPNLLFVNAGMVPFKPYFLQQETPPFDRAVSVQKCVRTLDIEEVGKTTRHGTFFQMNGNFSFGDYFKEGAIEHAWNLVTGSLDDGGYGFDARLGLGHRARGRRRGAADLAARSSACPTSASRSRGLLDNYWHMGVPGPGGPCSEIYVDRGAEFGPDGGPVVDEDRFLEIWNLVFMQEEITNVRAKDDFDVVGPLPSKNIDTGMGLERVAYLLQDKSNMYEIDEVFPVIEKASELSGRRYGADHDDDVRFRVIADHVRSGLMLIGDGVTPGNEAAATSCGACCAAPCARCGCSATTTPRCPSCCR